jgi:mannosyl-3-phosphoglycerate phosphatase
MTPKAQVLVFSDLDGCLLNKTDYDWSAARPTLLRLQRKEIPVILASSKTPAEMAALAADLPIEAAPFIAENGGTIHWTDELAPAGQLSTQTGPGRDSILEVLTSLKRQFRFESFRDLGIDGIMRTTQLPREQAERASKRHSTEPLIWQDTDDRLNEFREQLAAHNLTFTRGGRFWHVAGPTSKGAAMQTVLQRWQEVKGAAPVITIGIGDSPIDQSLLDVANFPVGIPAPDGKLYVEISPPNGRRASLPGAAGWAESVGQILDELE